MLGLCFFGLFLGKGLNIIVFLFFVNCKILFVSLRIVYFLGLFKFMGL